MYGGVITTADVPPGAALPAREAGAVPPPAKAWARRQVEKIRAAAFAGRFSALPFWDNYTEETAEIRRAYPQMIAEPVVKAGYGLAVMGVAALDVQTQPQDQDSARERDAAACFLAALRGIPGGHLGISGTVKLAWNVLTSRIRGWSATEMVWKDEPEKWGKFAGKLFYRDAKGKDTVNLVAEFDQFKNVKGLRSAFGPGHVLAPDEMADVVLCSHWPLWESLGGISGFRATYRPWWFKRLIWNLYGLGLEKWSGPYWKGTYPKGDEESKEALEAALADAESSTWITVPTGLLVDAIEVATGAAAVYEAAIDRCDREMLLSVRGSYLDVLEGKTPDGRGDTSVHQQTGDVGSWFDSATLAGCYTHQIAPRFYEVNYPDCPPCTVMLGAITEKELTASAALDSALLAMGMSLSVKDRRSFYGRQAPADAADALGAAPGKGPAPAASLS